MFLVISKTHIDTANNINKVVIIENDITVYKSKYNLFKSSTMRLTTLFEETN